MLAPPEVVFPDVRELAHQGPAVRKRMRSAKLPKTILLHYAGPDGKQLASALIQVKGVDPQVPLSSLSAKQRYAWRGLKVGQSLDAQDGVGGAWLVDQTWKLAGSVEVLPSNMKFHEKQVILWYPIALHLISGPACFWRPMQAWGMYATQLTCGCGGSQRTSYLSCQPHRVQFALLPCIVG